MLADHQHSAVVAQLVVNIGFVPAFEAMDAAHGRMLGVDDAGAKDAGVVLPEPAADQGRVALAIAENVRRTMDGHQAVPAFDII